MRVQQTAEIAFNRVQQRCLSFSHLLIYNSKGGKKTHI
uniref:Uncharacterized protein n=1 Tax=Arundo donax TaxID=35708 RepID=A0A0A8YSP6_ARUDO